MHSGQALTKPTTKGLSALDHDLDEQKPSSWSISTGLSPNTAVGYLRYGRDLFTPPDASETHNKTGGFRAEAELAATSPHDFFLAFRALKRVGRFSKAGLEVGLSTSNLHVSLYWSRLGQRISLPILTTVTTTTSTATTTGATGITGPINLPINHLLLTTLLLPLTAFSAYEAYTNLRRKTQAADALKSRRAAQLAAHVAARRAEADKLTVVLAAGVGPRQAAARKRGGLVILSAKYGVRGAPPDEVADVTIAVAGLIRVEDEEDEEDEGDELVIPGGVRKGRLLGFWDPAPGREKVLRVVYLWEGKEAVAEVKGREELRLP
jgi:DnaJ family protein C protein 11